MSKIKKTLLTTACTFIAAGMIALGCSPQRIEEPKKPKIEYPGMPAYNTNTEWFDSDAHAYAKELLFKNVSSSKKGLTSQISLEGAMVSLQTFYEHGIPENAQRDKDGFYTSEVVGIIQRKEFRKLNPKELSTTPMFTKYGKLTIIEYDRGLDKKLDYKIIIHEKWVEGKGIVKTQELDLDVDGTIDERIVTSSYDDYTYTFEKALD